MPHETLSFAQRLHEYGYAGYALILFISFWAGTVKYISSLNGDKPKIRDWFFETIISGFVGVITAMVCQYYHLDILLTGAISGIAAHNGTRSLYIIGSIIKKNTLQAMADPEPDEHESSIMARKADKKR